MEFFFHSFFSLFLELVLIDVIETIIKSPSSIARRRDNREGLFGKICEAESSLFPRFNVIPGRFECATVIWKNYVSLVFIK